MGKNEGKILNLGPRDILLKDRLFASCENISITVNDATDDELTTLRQAVVITLRPHFSVRLGHKS